MIGTVANLIAYSKAPKATYYMKHPVKAMAMRKLQGEVKENAKRVGLGLGAAAVAVPVGLWLGSKIK